MNKVKLKVKQDYATHDGMLYKDTKVFINEEYKNIWTTQSKIKVKDGMGKIWFIEPSFLELV
jgi:hypothetical protein|tara:strand:- start:151 stop:336 length:186 start_codon:yes stop_codon:yes gene_type:complete